MHIAQGMPRARRAGGASAARMDTEDELEGSVASGGGWHRAGGRGRGGRAGGGRVGGGGQVGVGSGAGGRGGRAGGASAARNGHRGRVQSVPCTIKKMDAK